MNLKILNDMSIRKKSLYPKTQRLGADKTKIIITEKLDGSNLGIFKLDSNNLIIAQRNNVLQWNLETHEETFYSSYKGLNSWLHEHGRTLLEAMHDNSGMFGEWIGMGHIKYRDTLGQRLYIFAKANLVDNREPSQLEPSDGDFSIKNLYYNPGLFKYVFIDQEIPEFIGVVTIVKETKEYPTVEELDDLYDSYTAEVNRPVEGFVINNNDVVRKYVRLKGGVLSEHKS